VDCESLTFNSLLADLYTQVAPQGSRISTVPWEYLHAGDTASEETEQQEPAWLSEGLLGSLMNEDSSVAVAAKVCVNKGGNHNSRLP